MRFFNFSIFGKSILLPFFALGYFTSIAANPQEQIDSIQLLLKKAKGDDAVELMYEIGKIYLENNDDENLTKTRFYANKLSAYSSGNINVYGKVLSKMLLGNILANEEKLDKSLKTHQSALMLLNKIPKRSILQDIKMARIYFHIADLYIRKFNISKGVDYLLKTIKLAEKLQDKNQIPFIARMKKDGVDPGKDLSIKEAVDYAKNHQEDLEVKILKSNGGQILGFTRGAYLRLGNLFMEVKDYKNALIYLKKAKKISEDMGAKQPHLKTLGSIAELYSKQNQLDSSIYYYKLLVKKAEEYQIVQLMARGSKDLGSIYAKKGDFKNALLCHEFIDELLKPVKDGSFVNIKMYDGLDKEAAKYIFPVEWANNRRFMADICMNSDSLKERGKKYYLSAIEVYEKVFPEMDIVQKDWSISNYDNLGDCYIQVGQFKKGLDLLNKALTYYKSKNETESILWTYKSLSDAYEKNADFKNANLFFKKFIYLKDSLYTEKNSQALANFQKRLEVEKKDGEIDLLNKSKKAQKAEIEKEKFARNATMIGLCMVGILALVILRSLYTNKKKNKLIIEQKRLVEEQKEHIEEKSKEITDSINYAKRIQQAILPPPEFLSEIIPNSFIFYRPKDVVSGDFYQFFQIKDELIIVTADCTGHGVPGAFMSMIGNEQLNKIINEKDIYKPSEILDALHLGIRKALRQDRAEGETRDGMDVALYKFNSKTLELEFAGANRPIWIFEDGTLTETKSNKQPIGGLQSDTRTAFTNHAIKLRKGSSVYTFTDGFADQFGGAKGKKFMLKNFERLLLSLIDKPMLEQKNIIQNEFDTWKGNHEQVDDVLIIGIRV